MKSAVGGFQELMTWFQSPNSEVAELQWVPEKMWRQCNIFLEFPKCKAILF